MCQRNKDRLKKRFQSSSIYNTMQSVFATISMALRGSTISLSLSFLRTQSGANLEHGGARKKKKKRRRDVWCHSCKCQTKSSTTVCAGLYILGWWVGLAGRGRDVKASVDGRVHLVFDDASLRVHLVFARGEAIDAAYSVQGFGKPHDILDFNREKK